MARITDSAGYSVFFNIWADMVNNNNKNSVGNLHAEYLNRIFGRDKYQHEELNGIK